MRIGLLRHFPVEHGFPTGRKTAAELHQWRQQYDTSPVLAGQADLGSFPWAQCVSSDLARAAATATAVYRGPVEQTTLLREVDFAPFQTGNLRLPLWLWRWLLQLAWATGHSSQRASRDEFRRRVIAAADLLEARANDILAVSHAGMMIYLSAELRRRGFGGPKLKMPKHATLYVYEKKAASRPAVTPNERDPKPQPTGATVAEP